MKAEEIIKAIKAGKFTETELEWINTVSFGYSKNVLDKLEEKIIKKIAQEKAGECYRAS